MPASRSLRTLPVLLAVALATACGKPPADTPEVIALDPATACNTLKPTPVAMAVRDYITTADPVPLRFLNAATTDSALPQAAAEVVQDKGPTFYWLPEEANRQQIRDKLARDGSWPTMLVVVREDRDSGDGTHLIRIAGHYIGSPHDGVESAEKQYLIVCQADSTATWVMQSGGSGTGGT